MLFLIHRLAFWQTDVNLFFWFGAVMERVSLSLTSNVKSLPESIDVSMKTYTIGLEWLTVLSAISTGRDIWVSGMSEGIL